MRLCLQRQTRYSFSFAALASTVVFKPRAKEASMLQHDSASELVMDEQLDRLLGSTIRPAVDDSASEQ